MPFCLYTRHVVQRYARNLEWNGNGNGFGIANHSAQLCIANRSSKAKSELEREVIRRVIEESFRIWCKRNWSEHNRLLDNLHA